MQAMQASKLSPVCVFGFLMGGGLMNTIEKGLFWKCLESRISAMTTIKPTRTTTTKTRRISSKKNYEDINLEQNNLYNLIYLLMGRRTV